MLLLLLAVALCVGIISLALVNFRLAQKRDEDLAKTAADKAISETLRRIEA
jgi:hypothetical protein